MMVVKVKKVAGEAGFGALARPRNPKKTKWITKRIGGICKVNR